MAPNLKSRIERVARALPRAAGKFVIVRPTYRGDDPPIEGLGSSHVRLNVPTSGRDEDEDDFDPRRHLTDEQRAVIGPHDTVINIHSVRKPPPHE